MKRKKRGLLGGGGGLYCEQVRVGTAAETLTPPDNTAHAALGRHGTCSPGWWWWWLGVNERWLFLVFVESRNEWPHEERRRRKKKSARWKPRHQIWTTWEWEWFHTHECLYGFDASDSNTTSDEGGGTRLATRWSKSWVASNNSGVQSVPLLRVHIHVITWIVPVLMEAARPIYMWLFTQHAKLKPLTRQSYRWWWIRERLVFL